MKYLLYKQLGYIKTLKFNVIYTILIHIKGFLYLINSLIFIKKLKVKLNWQQNVIQNSL